jgi:thioesterase domain-containing protein
VRDLFQRTARGYALKPYSGRIELFLMAERTAMNDSLFDPMLGTVDPWLGWGAVAAQVERHWLEGEHVTILQEPNVARLVETLTPALAS